MCVLELEREDREELNLNLVGRENYLVSWITKESSKMGAR